MSVAFVAACLWVVAACAVAFLPLRLQYLPGALLLAAAPVLIWALATAHGWPLALLLGLAVLSLFRRPLLHLVRKGERS